MVIFLIRAALAGAALIGGAALVRVGAGEFTLGWVKKDAALIKRQHSFKVWSLLEECDKLIYKIKL